jgi:hypothetical protein
VQFVSLIDKKQMPQLPGGYDWPYSEGLRMDEAMNPLTLLCVGCYGQDAAQPERRAGEGCDSVEVRLQVGKVDRENQLHRQAAAHSVE